jgi:PAS domain S-box-containing protein
VSSHPPSPRQPADGRSARRDHDLLAAELVTRTEQLRVAEQTLAQSAYELTENIPVGTYVLTFDAGGLPRFTFVSRRWLQMLDLRREDVMADHSLAIQAVHPDEREAFIQLNAEVGVAKKRFSWEGRIVVRGETRWVSIESIPRDRPEGGTIWEGVMIDITERVEAVAALAESETRHRRQLENKLQTSLEAAAIAHEIKQPLARVLLQARLAAANPAGRDAALATISAEARAVERTIEKMRVLLRSVQTSHEPVDLRTVIDSSLLQVKWQLAEHGIDLVQRGSSKPACLEGDDAQLQLAVTNLVRNAIESIAEAGPPVRRIVVSIRRSRDQLTLSISDSGPGWSGVERKQLPFSTTKAGGSGIGLSIVRAVVQHHAGEISFHRSADGGAEVRLRFPATRRLPSPSRGGR